MVSAGASVSAATGVGVRAAMSGVGAVVSGASGVAWPVPVPVPVPVVTDVDVSAVSATAAVAPMPNADDAAKISTAAPTAALRRNVEMQLLTGIPLGYQVGTPDQRPLLRECSPADQAWRSLDHGLVTTCTGTGATARRTGADGTRVGGRKTDGRPGASWHRASRSRWSGRVSGATAPQAEHQQPAAGGEQPQGPRQRRGLVGAGVGECAAAGDADDRSSWSATAAVATGRTARRTGRRATLGAGERWSVACGNVTFEASPRGSVTTSSDATELVTVAPNPVLAEAGAVGLPNRSTARPDTTANGPAGRAPTRRCRGARPRRRTR